MLTCWRSPSVAGASWPRSIGASSISSPPVCSRGAWSSSPVSRDAVPSEALEERDQVGLLGGRQRGAEVVALVAVTGEAGVEDEPGLTEGKRLRAPGGGGEQRAQRGDGSVVEVRRAGGEAEERRDPHPGGAEARLPDVPGADRVGDCRHIDGERPLLARNVEGQPGIGPDPPGAPIGGRSELGV